MAELKKELKNYLQSRSLPIQNPLVKVLEQSQIDPDVAAQEVINKGHEFGETLADNIRLVGNEGKIETSILYPDEAIDPNHRPYVRVIKFRHTHFNPEVVSQPKKISPNPTPFEQITRKLALEPADVLMLSVELRPGYKDNQLDANSHIIRVKTQAWGKVPDQLIQPVTLDPTILSCIQDYETGQHVTTIDRVFEGSTDPKIVSNIDDDLIALTPLVFGHKRLWSQTEEIESISAQLTESITPFPQRSVASSILTTRQLKKTF